MVASPVEVRPGASRRYCPERCGICLGGGAGLVEIAARRSSNALVAQSSSAASRCHANNFRRTFYYRRAIETRVHAHLPSRSATKGADVGVRAKGDAEQPRETMKATAKMKLTWPAGHGFLGSGGRPDRRGPRLRTRGCRVAKQSAGAAKSMAENGPIRPRILRTGSRVYNISRFVYNRAPGKFVNQPL